MWILNTGMNFLSIQNIDKYEEIKDFLMNLDIDNKLLSWEWFDLQKIEIKDEKINIFFITHSYDVIDFIIFLAKKFSIIIEYEFVEENNDFVSYYYINNIWETFLIELQDNDFILSPDEIEELWEDYVDYYLEKLFKKKENIILENIDNNKIIEIFPSLENFLLRDHHYINIHNSKKINYLGNVNLIESIDIIKLKDTLLNINIEYWKKIFMFDDEENILLINTMEFLIIINNN